ncbi:spore coat protein [Litchfieldia alkalitelluris]|uniref:spore coat protein n=1 Tax=Litchfieldia alkalitelluris TaxID=304268 RepID=UPI000998741A|nr:spore coat protein [Litchfieldia alkalitelluris]
MADKPKQYKWQALDESCDHPTVDAENFEPQERFEDNEVDALVEQEATQENKIFQGSEEVIIIKDSCNIEVDTTDTQVAVSLQAALQVAIAIVIRLTIANDITADTITQDLLQSSKTKQSNFQELVIKNSRDVKVKTTDTDISVSLQLLLQLLVALVAQVEVA